MPNWCLTHITFETATNDERSSIALRDFYDKISNQLEYGPNYIDNGFGYGWLGNYTMLSGLVSVDQAKNDYYEGYRCRGCITYLDDFYEDNFYLIQQDAWSPNLAIWQGIINKLYTDPDTGLPLINIYYQAEEPGMELYATNDYDNRYYPEKYIVDLCIELQPGIFPFYTQIPGSPFIKINNQLIEQNNIDFHMGSFHYSEYSNRLITFNDEINCRKYVNSEEEVLNEIKKYFPEVSSIEETNNKIKELRDLGMNNIFGNIYSYDPIAIEDMDPIEPPKSGEKIIENLLDKINKEEKE